MKPITTFFLMIIVLCLLVPTTASSRQKARRASCGYILIQLHQAVVLYRDDYKVYPQRLSLLEAYLREEGGVYFYFTCPIKNLLKPITINEIDRIKPVLFINRVLYFVLVTPGISSIGCF